MCFKYVSTSKKTWLILKSTRGLKVIFFHFLNIALTFIMWTVMWLIMWTADGDDEAGCSSSSGIESVSPEARLADQGRPGVNILLLLIIFIIILGSIRSIKVVVICPRISLFAKMESLPNYSTLSLVLCSALHSLPPSSNFWTNLPPQSGESPPPTQRNPHNCNDET